MGRGTSYPSELRERTVRMVAEVRPEYPSDWPMPQHGLSIQACQLSAVATSLSSPPNAS